MRPMKDSGIEWIGEIPEGWDVRRMKFSGELDSNGVDKKQREGEKLYKSVHYMDVYRNSLHEIGNGGNYLIISADDRKREACILKKGDVLLTTSSENPDDMGHSVVIYEDLVETLFGYHLMRFRPSIQLSLHLEKYLIGSHYMRQWFEYRSIGMTRYGISRRDVADAKLILPPLSEQTRIASFLDKKCAAIDFAIENQRALIDKLKEYRQAMITEAVTKGLNSDVLMKDSGIEWIGEIPEGWKIGRIKNVCSKIVDCPHSTPDYSVSKTPYYCIKTSEINDGKIMWELLQYVSEETYMKRTERLAPAGNDIVYAREGSYGDAIILPPNCQFCLGQRVMLLRTNKKIPNSRFLWYTIRSEMVYLQAKEKNTGSTAGRVNLSDVNEFIIFLPTFEEQEEIIQYLDQKSSAIDLSIAKKEQLIDLLTEYKKSLIYEAVTGKIEVPEECEVN